MPVTWSRALRGLAVVCFLAPAAAAAAQDASRLVHLLDYIAVDYAEAVGDDGALRDEGEYREMQEFSAAVRQGIAALPANARREQLAAGAQALALRIEKRAKPAEVAAAATTLRRELVDAYGVTVGPRTPPDPARAKVLYAEHCASCHGAGGRGDGILAKGMDPAPSDFGDAARQRQRSVHGLFNTITLGVEGTAMRAFAELSAEDRWSLAFLASAWGVSPEAASGGRAAWEAGRGRERFANLSTVAGRSAVEVEAEAGREAADIHAYLRAQPGVLAAARGDPLEFARAQVAESVRLHEAGQRDAAVQAALTAYLEGFERVEPALASVDGALLRRVEALLAEHREALRRDEEPSQVRARVARIDAALEEAARALAGPGLSPAAAAAASFLILLREGLEAVLVVAALLAVLRRGGRAADTRYIHRGWVAALAAGIATWAAATWLIRMSGAQREITEGVAALGAAALLFYVGFWLHDKSHASAWQSFVMRNASSSRAGAWGLAFMAFLAVYREVFETVLFYQALWAQAPAAGGAIVGGFVAAAVALAAITWAMLRLSLRLPLGLFFGASGLLLVLLAIVMAGHGVAALQEAGTFAATPVAAPTVTWLGIHPNAQGLAVQAVLAVVGLALFLHSRRRSRAAAL